MRATEAYTKILALDRPVVSTAEVSSLLGIHADTASQLLARLARDGLVIRLRRGLWAIGSGLNPYVLAPFLTAPYPAYISTWTALYHHGMIDQIPRGIYVVSLDRAKRIVTSLGTFVVQRINPQLFDGYEAKDGVSMAVPEKALFDTVYLAAVRGKRHAFFPEIEIPGKFSESKVRNWIRRITLPRLRVLVDRRTASLFGSAKQPVLQR